jgi:DNA-binding XRE family transcriptional regulator
MIAQLITDIEALGASLRRGNAINVNDQSSKDRAIALATHYFGDLRPRVVAVGGETESVLQLDELWQLLVRLAHGNNARRTYLKIIGSLRKQLSEFNIAALATPVVQTSKSSASSALSREETLVLQTLEELVPSAAASYRQGLSDLLGPARLSYRGTAAEFREALRETLDHLAPDAEVEKQKWYKAEEGQTKPTMKQKARYILVSRAQNKTQRATAEKMFGLIEELSGEVMRAVYNRASLATHVHQSKNEVKQIKRYVDTVFFDLLEIAQ